MEKEKIEQARADEASVFEDTCDCGCGNDSCQCGREKEQKEPPLPTNPPVYALTGRWDWYGQPPSVWWEEASIETREMAFLAVTALMHKAELQEKGSYRWALYDVFGFDEGMYAAAMEAGYMDIHNALSKASEFPCPREIEEE